MTDVEHIDVDRDRGDFGADRHEVEISRNGALAGVIALVGAVLAIGFLWRAGGSGAIGDWLMALIMVLVGGAALRGLLDARTPLLVADSLGVRIRLGREWRGVPWGGLAQVVVERPDSLLRDGRVALVARDPEAALAGLDGAARRQVALSRRWYGAPLAVPLAITTRSSSGLTDLVEDLGLLADGRTEVVELLGRDRARLDEPRLDEPRLDQPRLDQPRLDEPEPASHPAPVAEPASPVADSEVFDQERYDEPIDKIETVDPVEVVEVDEVVEEPEVVEVDEVVEEPEVVEELEAAETDDLVADEPAADPVVETDGALEPDGFVEDGLAQTHDRSEDRWSRAVARLGELVSRFGHGRAHDVDADRPRPSDPERKSDLEQESGSERLEERVEEDRGPHDLVEEVADEVPAPVRVVDPVAPLRAARRGARADVTHDLPRRPVIEQRPPEADAEADAEVESETGVDAVSETDTGGAPVRVVVDDLSDEDQRAAREVDPVIGPDVLAARTRAGLSIDELSERTRIRPHVLEAIEVDDFAPCGGDFYARGHLSTLARYLGLDQERLLATYDENYAHAPINARRVFEAELAGGISGGIRGTSGGPKWGLLAGAVLCLLMVWGVARFFSDTPAELAAPAGDSAGLAASDHANKKPITSPLTTTRTLTLKAMRSDSMVVVRDRKDKVIWSGTLHSGATQKVAGLAPFKVRADHAGSVQVSLGKKDLGRMGAPSETATRTFGR